MTGTAAGILYGAEQIPERWLTALLGREKLLTTARRFASLFPVQTATN